MTSTREATLSHLSAAVLTWPWRTWKLMPRHLLPRDASYQRCGRYSTKGIGSGPDTVGVSEGRTVLMWVYRLTDVASPRCMDVSGLVAWPDVPTSLGCGQGNFAKRWMCPHLDHTWVPPFELCDWVREFLEQVLPLVSFTLNLMTSFTITHHSRCLSAFNFDPLTRWRRAFSVESSLHFKRSLDAA